MLTGEKTQQQQQQQQFDHFYDAPTPIIKRRYTLRGVYIFFRF
jgi:hypothetical protein